MRIIYAAALAALTLGTPAAVQAEDLLEKVIIFSRHGVRPPTSQKTLDPLSEDPWPEWPVPDGNLTPHGAQAATLMGQHYRTLYVRPGFLGEGCPAAGDVFAWADKAQRTRATGDAILAGLFPGCGIRAKFSKKAADALFHPIAAGVAPVDAKAAKAEALAAMGGDFAAAKGRYAADFARLAEVLHGPDPQTCVRAGLGGSCKLIDLPWGLKTNKNKGNNFSLEGPLQMASTVAETIRLEYAEGMTGDRLGFGRVRSAQDVKALLALHKAQYDVSLRIPAVARRGASQLLNQIADALEQGTGEEPATGPPAAKLLLLVGHDTNIGQMQATLGVSWTLAGYPQNDTPPAGALLFERWRNTATGERFVRLAYTAQSLDQIRHLTPLTGNAKPEHALLNLPGCAPTPAAVACRLADFLSTVRQRIDRTALAPVSYR